MGYSKTTWVTGDTITAAKLNNMEDGIYDAYAKNGNSGRFQETTSINSGDTYTKNVALGDSDYSLAIVHFSLGTSTFQGGLVIARDSQTSPVSLYSFQSTGNTNLEAYNRNYDSYLSKSDASAIGLSGSAYIGLTDCYINGSNLTFTWRNSHPTDSKTLAVNVDWQVIR